MSEIERLDGRVDRLSEHIDSRFDSVDLRFDGLNTILLEQTRQLGELKGTVKTLLWVTALGLPVAMGICTAVLGWILSHSRFVG